MEAGTNPWAVARLRTGYVQLNPNQYYRGYTSFSAGCSVRELFELSGAERAAHWPRWSRWPPPSSGPSGPKLNYEALGNIADHLHRHLVPRHHDDPRPWRPIWENLDYLRLVWTGQHEDDPGVRQELRSVLLAEQRRADVDIEADLTG